MGRNDELLNAALRSRSHSCRGRDFRRDHLIATKSARVRSAGSLARGETVSGAKLD
jgi:hypothetical protein